MKKLLSTKYTDFSLNLALLILRLGAGVLMIPHGFDKLTDFNNMKSDFMQFLGLSAPLSLALLIFAEFFCSILITAGLFTRLACVPLIIAMAVAGFDAHGGDIFGKGQTAILYLVAYITLLLTGPGKFSADKALGK